MIFSSIIFDGIYGVAEKAVLNIVHETLEKDPKIPVLRNVPGGGG